MALLAFASSILDILKSAVEIAFCEWLSAFALNNLKRFFIFKVILSPINILVCPHKRF